MITIDPNTPEAVPAQQIIDTYPLSPMQQGMLFHHLYNPLAGFNIEQVAITLHEEVNAPVLRQAWSRVVDRHTVLRTAFHWEDSEPRQEVSAEVVPAWQEHDLSACSCADREARMERFLQEDRQRGFDLRRPPLLRLALFRMDQKEYRLVWSLHHAILDGRAFVLVLREVFAFYQALQEGAALRLDTPRPYRDYITWLQQQESLQPEGSQAEAYWRTALAGVDESTLLAAVFPKRRQTGSSVHEVQEIRLSEGLTTGLRTLSDRYELTPNTVVQGAWALLLSRYTGKEDVVFGVTRACRKSAMNGADDLAGLVINTLPLRVAIPADAHLIPWLRALRALNVEVRPYEHTPLLNIQRWCRVDANSPLFDTLVVFENYTLNTALKHEGDPWERRHIELYEKPTYPLSVNAYLDAELLIRITYDADQFDSGQIARLLGHFQTLLEGIVTDPQRPISELLLLTAPERRQLLVEWNNTAVEYDRKRCAHQLFEAQVERTPDQIAVCYADQHLTYAELNARANQLAHYLIQFGVGPEAFVGLCMNRSVEMVVGILGVLKAGAAYVPLDPTYPLERLAFMIEDAQLSVLLSQEACLDALPSSSVHVLCLDLDWWQVAGESENNPQSHVSADNAAYVIYTSGTTGNPKGALIRHGGLTNYLTWSLGAYDVAGGTGSPVHSSLSFDLTVTSLFPTLLSGGTAWLLPDANGVEALSGALRAHHDFSLVKITPAHLQLLSQEMSAEEASGCTRAFVIGGEALLADQLDFWRERAPHTRLINEYGPTETVVGCCVYECPAEGALGSGSVPIGRPIANTHVYVLDARLKPVAIGVRGELYIGGDGLARGYVNRPDLTAERFVPDPFSSQPGERLYRTGDVCRYLSDGRLEYLNRVDHQVKVRGFRIELGEVESVISHHRSLRDAVVIVREDNPGDRRLVAYGVATEGEEIGIAELRPYLKEKLPEYMIPSAFVLLEALPLTPNGKVDRKALLALQPERPEVQSTFAEPRTAAEATLAQIWSEVLRVDRVGIHDNFFELGGDSILRIQIISRAAKAGLRIPPKQMFQHLTIAELTSEMEDSDATTLADQGMVEGPTALGPIQRWFFERNLPEPHHFNQAMLLKLVLPLDDSLLELAIAAVVAHHDALRLRYHQTKDGWLQSHETGESAVAYSRVDLSSVHPEKQETLEAAIEEYQRTLDLSQGPLLRVIHFFLGPDEAERLLIVIHHLVVDGISWRILLEDLSSAYECLARGERPLFPRKTTSFKQWTERLLQYSDSKDREAEVATWIEAVGSTSAAIPVDMRDGENTVANERYLLDRPGRDLVLPCFRKMVVICRPSFFELVSSGVLGYSGLT